MKKKFKHLSYEERVAISFLHAEGRSARKIGEKLGRHHSCIAYELKKKVKGLYVAKKAHHKSYWRRYLSNLNSDAVKPEIGSSPK